MFTADLTNILLRTGAGHGDDGPVEGLGQGVEGGVGLVLLQRVRQTREYEHAHADRHREQQQLPSQILVLTQKGAWAPSSGREKMLSPPVAIAQREAECLEPGNVPRQLEYSQDSQYAENLCRFCHPLKRVLRVQEIEKYGDKER